MSVLRHTLLYLILTGVVICVSCRGPQEPAVNLAPLSDRLETAVHEEIQAGNIPGAVILIGNHKQVLYHQAFGCCRLVPEKTAMETDCIFDIASLSKPVSTASCIHLLMDRGRLSLDTKVAELVPAFGVKGKQAIQIRHLLSHTSGLPAYTSAEPLEEKNGTPCPAKVLEQICSLNLQSEPGQTFRYSCLGYIVLGHIVHIVSGQPLDVFARENLFAPLGMTASGYNPDKALSNRIAPTEMRHGHCLTGQVHDPLAGLMAGVSGNAGVFSTAEDLGRFCAMLLNGGRYQGRQILSPQAVSLLTQEQILGRAYGFDVNSSYAWVKGDGFSPAAFCHTGFTGTSMVCDPVNDVYLIVLTNRVHPDGKGSVTALRKKTAAITADCLISPANVAARR